MSEALSPLHQARRVVVKISSSLLVDGASASINQAWLDEFIADIVACQQRGQDIILVTSGAVALGRRLLKLPTGTLQLEESQAAAACGQIKLIHAYQETLARHERALAQLLLTPHDTEARQPYLNVRATLRNLLRFGVLPVINENDAVTTPASRFTDNDQLAARVAAMMEADCLVLLSDIDGLYTADPRLDPAARFIPEVRHITPEIAAMAGDSRSGTGRGGMKTKLAAAKIAMQAGCALAIARGSMLRPLSSLLAGGRGTWFMPEHTPLAAWKIWIGGSLNPRGALTIDSGAEQALRQGKSLLAAGVTHMSGQFGQGDPVRVVNIANQEIARGLIAYNSHDTSIIMGHKSEAFASLLGYAGHDELIHRDDLVLL